MAPSRRKGGKAAAAAAARRQWKIGDLVLAKVKGFPAWPAMVSEPEKWGYPADWKKVMVHFFGTQQIAFCNPADVEAFTEEKKQSLLTKRHAKGAEFILALKEIVESYEKLKQQEQAGDPTAAEEMTTKNGGDPVEALQVRENPSGASRDTPTKSDPCQGRGESSLLSEDASAAEQMLALHSVAREQAFDSVMVKEPRKIATYSSRKRNGGTRTQKCALAKNMSLVQNSKRSSRYVSDGLQSFTFQCSDDGQSVDDMDDGASRRRKRSWRSLGRSESDDMGSSALYLNGSDEENASEVATVESDNNTRNDADSGSKVEHSDSAGDCFEGDHELGKGLNFQIKTIVVKKKRKPTRKRGTSDVTDPTTKVVAEEGLGIGACNSCYTSRVLCKNDRPSEGNGDEHLPLVKRARVRMSRTFYTDDEGNTSSQVGEKSSKDVAFNIEVQTSPACNHDKEAASAAEESKNAEVSAKLSGDSAGVVLSAEENPSDVVPSSKSCIQIAGDRSIALEFRCNETSKSPDDEAARPLPKQFSSSPDGEAILPSSAFMCEGTGSMTVTAPEEVQVHSGASITVNSMTNESDLPVVQFPLQNDKDETSMEPDSLNLFANNASALCPGLDTTVSEVPAHSSGQYESLNRNSCGHSLVNPEDYLNGKSDKNDDCMIENVQPQYVGSSPSFQLMMNKPETKEPQLKEEQKSASMELDNGEQTRMNQNPILSIYESDVLPEDAELQCDTGSSNCEDAIDENRQLNKIGETEEGTKEAIQTAGSVSMFKNLSSEKISSSPVNIADSPPKGTPHSITACHISTAESASVTQNNGSCSPNVRFNEKKILGDSSVDRGEELDTVLSQGHKFAADSDAQSTLESFESVLTSLVRTKESIGRATRLAMDCGKFGVSSKAMEILAHTLESESNLERRVDLFFLVDSIAQCSKGLKGDAGGVYLSEIQVMLPRLLGAAVPAGATTQENQKQCLKVLRLWLERRILPESIIRNHIRELDSQSMVSACLYSRRSARTERLLDDPVRDMEGMLVDEYGSNSTLQLPGFCMPSMLKDEDEGSDSDGGDFESVTPEHDSRIPEELVIGPTPERHTRILEDVDGELEMEDVAPSWEAGNGANGDQADNAESSQGHFGQQLQSVSGPSHQHVPSTSPPPPPLPLCPPRPAMSDSYLNSFDCGGYHSMHGDNQAGAAKIDLPMPADIMRYQGAESLYSNSCVQPPVNSTPQAEGSNFQHQPYPPHPPPPPPPPPPHQYPYAQPGHHMKSHRDDPPPYSCHYMPSFDEQNFHDNHDRMRRAPYETRDHWRYPPPFSYGPRYHDKPKGPYPLGSYGGPPREQGRFHNHRWNYPPRPFNHRNSFHHKPHSEGPVPVGMRDPGMWNHR